MVDEFQNKGIRKYITPYVRGLGDLSGKRVVDVPAGVGRTSELLVKQGAEVLALDLYPEFIKAEGCERGRADLLERLPVEDGWADYVVCQEGIEHLPNHLRALEEFNRILKPGGLLILTTPNLSNMRSRLSWLFFETDMLRRMPPTEIDSIWFSDAESDQPYFGHLFLTGVHRLQSLLRIAGFESQERHRTKISGTSLFFTLLLYPLLSVISLRAFWSYPKKHRNVDPQALRAVFKEHLGLNLSFKTNTCRTIFWVQRKTRDIPAARARLRALDRSVDGLDCDRIR